MWDTLIVNPMINALLWFYNLLGQNFILAIAFLTILIRLITLPLNMRQQRSMMRQQELQPEINAIQKKYRDNPQKMNEEFKRIGYNPADTLSGCLPTLLQFPILIGLYQAITTILGTTPQALFELVPRVYSAINVTQLIPVENKFAWLNLSQPDPFFILPLIVFHPAEAADARAAQGADAAGQPGGGHVAVDDVHYAADVRLLLAAIPVWSVDLLHPGQYHRYRPGPVHEAHHRPREGRAGGAGRVIEAEKATDKSAKSRPSANGAGDGKSKPSGTTSTPRRKKGSAKR